MYILCNAIKNTGKGDQQKVFENTLPLQARKHFGPMLAQTWSSWDSILNFKISN